MKLTVVRVVARHKNIVATNTFMSLGSEIEGSAVGHHKGVVGFRDAFADSLDW